MANTLDQFPTEATTIPNDSKMHVKIGTGVNTDKWISGYNVKQAIINTNPIENYGGALLYGSVVWLQDLDFLVTPCGYVIGDTGYTSIETAITLDAADATHPRIDAIWVNTSGVAGKTTGTAAADPASPVLDDLVYLTLTYVNVAANATTPTDTGIVLLYGENAGDPTEWDATVPVGGARIALDDTADPYAGTTDILCTSAVAGDYIQLTAGSLGVAVGDISSLEMHVKPITFGNNRYFRVAFFYGNLQSSAWVQLRNGNFGFDSSDTSAYQTINIPNSEFSFSNAMVDSVRFLVSGSGPAISTYIDQVRLQTGNGITIINITQGLTEDQLINNVRTWNVQQPFGNGTLTDGATIDWDLDVNPIATVTLGGDRTITFRNARAGGTYILKVIQDGTGTRLMSAWTNVLWAGGTAPTLTTAAAGIDVFSFVAFDSTNLVGAVAGQAIA